MINFATRIQLRNIFRRMLIEGAAAPHVGKKRLIVFSRFEINKSKALPAARSAGFFKKTTTMTKNEFKQQLIISMAGDTATFWKSAELISRANRVTIAAEKAGITFDGDTRQPSSDVTQYRKGMQNAVVINGTVYEMVDVPDGSNDCETCALKDECNNADYVICNVLFGDKTAAGKNFKKL